MTPLRLIGRTNYSAADEAAMLAIGGTALRGPAKERTETFFVDDARRLVRSVVPASGDPYQHTCTEKSYTDGLYTSDELAVPFCGETLAKIAGVPLTQAAVALAFLKERGCVVDAAKRLNKKADAWVFEDGMVEYHALREKQ